jgi:hypothetical protein
MITAVLLSICMGFSEPVVEDQDAAADAIRNQRITNWFTPASNYYVDPSLPEAERNLLLEAMQGLPQEAITDFVFVDGAGQLHANKPALLSQFETYALVADNVFVDQTGEEFALPMESSSDVLAEPSEPPPTGSRTLLLRFHRPSTMAVGRSAPGLQASDVLPEYRGTGPYRRVQKRGRFYYGAWIEGTVPTDSPVGQNLNPDLPANNP